MPVPSGASTPDIGKDEAGVHDKAASIAGDSFDAKEETDELDPVALNKAFKFATWSSVVLVNFLILSAMSSSIPDFLLLLLVRRPYSPHTTSALLLSTCLHCCWICRMGFGWYCVDVLVLVYCRSVSSLRE